ncbi:MAG: HEPN domain-containing protein [Deltaproteobacteria bacterium]|nr:HEPN domain-containing protein [Deltaproteobacteria bacterium]
MTEKGFDASDWIDRVVTALRVLASAQEPYLQAHWQHNPREQIIVDGRDETPFPLDDVRVIYAEARYSLSFGREAEYAPLRRVLDPARHALLSHPELERVAVAGRIVGENDFWMRLVNSGTSISAGGLIAGLMARAAELSGDGLRTAVCELNAFLSPARDGKAAGVLGSLDEGCDVLLFYGLTVSERIDVEDAMAIFPFGEVRRFVDQELVEELAPPAAGFHGWRSVAAVVRPFRWRPEFRRRGSVNDPMSCPPAPFFPEAQTFLDLLAVSHAAPMLRLATISGCIDRSAARLLGLGRKGPGIYQKWVANGFEGFAECPVLRPAALDEAREAFEERQSARYQEMAPFVARLAEALGRDGRFAMHDKVVDVVIALEGMYELPKRKKLRKLENRVSGFLGTDADDRRKIRESVRSLYEARSAVVHSGSREAWPFRNGAAFVKGFDLARRSLFKFLREGVPENRDKLGAAGE